MKKLLIIFILIFGLVSAANSEFYINNGDVRFTGDVNVDGEIHADGDSGFYGGFKIEDNTTETVVRADSEWQALTVGVITGMTHGFTFAAGSIGEIASVADAGAGNIVLTDVAHGLSIGNYITINDTGNYDDVYRVNDVTTDTFMVTATYVATDTGYWQRGASLTCDAGSDGSYQGMWSSSGIAATNNDVFEFSPRVNLARSANAQATRTFSNASYGSFSGSGFTSLVAGDVVWFCFRNTTGAGNMTITTINLQLNKL